MTEAGTLHRDEGRSQLPTPLEQQSISDIDTENKTGKVWDKETQFSLQLPDG